MYLVPTSWDFRVPAPCPMTVLRLSDLRKSPIFGLLVILNASLDHRAAGTTQNLPAISPNLQQIMCQARQPPMMSQV